MLSLANGNKYRDSAVDPMELEGYTLLPDNKTFQQNFLPCKYRKMKGCGTCPKSVVRPTCELKKITTRLNCVGCLQRKT